MPAAPSTILVIGDVEEPTLGVRARLQERGHRTRLAQSPDQGIEQLDEVDLVVLTPPIRTSSASETLARLRASDPNVPVVVAGSPRHVRPEELMHEGAFECVLDPLDHPSRLLSAVGYALGAREEDRELRYLRRQEGGGLGALVGEDPSMEPVFDFVRRVCARTGHGVAPPILVTGETGAGKGALAKAIHDEGVRRHRPFVTASCAALPPSYMESELFGYEKGGFADASRAKPGLFETAHRGTLFLDELPSLPLDLQAKVLKAIEDGWIRRLGGRDPIEIDVQVVAAAPPVLKAMVKEGSFREDLYHRLTVLQVDLPPLRDRGQDRVTLAERFVDELCRRYAMPPLRLAPSALSFIKTYHWPGNVRELRNQIERIVLLSERDAIEGWQFKRATGELTRIEPQDGPQTFRVTLPPDGLDLTVLEREVIRHALDRHEGNVSQTARYLSISRQTLIYRIKKHGLGGSA